MIYFENVVKYSETVETVRNSYLLINHQLKLVVNEVKKYNNRFNGLQISQIDFLEWTHY